MIYATIISVFSLLCSFAIVVFDRWSVHQHLAASAAREDKLLQRIQAPQAAIAQQTVADAAQYAGEYPQPYIGAFDDDAAAEYEQKRSDLEQRTHELIASVEGAE